MANKKPVSKFPKTDGEKDMAAPGLGKKEKGKIAKPVAKAKAKGKAVKKATKRG